VAPGLRGTGWAHSRQARKPVASSHSPYVSRTLAGSATGSVRALYSLHLRGHPLPSPGLGRRRGAVQGGMDSSAVLMIAPPRRVVAKKHPLTTSHTSTFGILFSAPAHGGFSLMLLLLLLPMSQAGVVLALCILSLGYTCVGLTALSISAISTNGRVRGGGAYYMIRCVHVCVCRQVCACACARLCARRLPTSHVEQPHQISTAAARWERSLAAALGSSSTPPTSLGRRSTFSALSRRPKWPLKVGVNNHHCL